MVSLKLSVKFKWWVKPYLKAATVFVWCMHPFLTLDKVENLGESMGRFIAKRGVVLKAT